MTRRARQHRLGLKVRVVIAFAVGAAVVSIVLALTTFSIVRSQWLSQREASARHQALNNAQLIKQELSDPSASVADALSTLALGQGNRALIHRGTLWFSSGAAAGGRPVTPALASAVRGGKVAEQRVMTPTGLAVAVGVPLPSAGVDYFEERSLAELVGTLSTLETVLIVAATATTLGGALAGWWASRRLTRPLADMAAVASEITEGDLRRRLSPDPDLDPLVSSFNTMVDTLERRLDQDARFASDVSHELRSPLTSIGAALELLDSYRTVLPEDGRVAVETLDAEVARFSTLVEDLLEMARLDAGVNALNLAEVPVRELAERAVAEQDRSIALEVDDSFEDVVLRLDKRRIQRVLANLLDNAAVHAGGAVAVRLERNGPWVTIAVEDRGPGIAIEERGRIFDRFYRGAASGQRSEVRGTGLGLALVAEHVEAHGGGVSVETAPGGGARFVVRLPVPEAP